MPGISDVEESLFAAIGGDQLRTSLGLIRQAAAKLWAPDAPRIIQDFTDDGIEHSERVAGYTARLLEANDGQPLTCGEMYLLLGLPRLPSTLPTLLVLSVMDMRPLARSRRKGVNR